MAPSHRKRRLARLTRPLRDAAVVPLLETLRIVVARLPQGAALAIGRWLGRAAWLACAGYRRRAERQLELAGIGGDAAGRRRLTRRMFESLGMNALECLNATGWNDAQFLARVRFDRLDPIRAALDRGRGLMPVTGHMGNWELLPRAYRLWMGYSASFLMAGQRNRRLNAWMIRLRRMSGNEVIATEAGALAPMRILRRGGTLALLADQDSTRARGIFVTFFGRPAYTPIGPALLAQRTGAAMLPMTIQREEGDPRRHIIRVGEPIIADPRAPAEAEAARLTQEYTRQLEAHIRARPEHWVWLHERWRHQPGEKIRVRSAGGRRAAI